jgi:glycosyltransferase involved in cell wall biosynthesis
LTREAEDCPHRVLLSLMPATEPAAHCLAVGRILGPSLEHLSRINGSVCRACCEHDLPSPSGLNPVVASLIFGAAGQVLDDVRASWREREDAARSQVWVQDHLQSVQGKADDRSVTGRFPIRSPQQWMVGVITAPRRRSTLDQSLRGLQKAGFRTLHIFAEPGSQIPDQFSHLPRTVHDRPLSYRTRIIAALASLFAAGPTADAYALFDDGVQPAPDLGARCDDWFWPQGAGLVSLYSEKPRQNLPAGWRVESGAPSRSLGARALVFRRDVLTRFLTDRQIFDGRDDDGFFVDDRVVGEWAAARGIKIAYHTPSLVAEIKEGMNARDGAEVARAGIEKEPVSGTDKRLPQRHRITRPPAIGLVGWNTPSGLGYANRDLATHLPVARWLVPPHYNLPTLAPLTRRVPRIDHVPLTLGDAALRHWLRDLDWVIFVETSCLPRFAHCAHDMGVRVACVPMWEQTDLKQDWVRLTDLMLCPTRFTFDLFNDWKHRFGFAWDLVLAPWPVDTRRRFRFRKRRRCERFLFVNGGGGARCVRLDGTVWPYRRKGMEVLLQAARMLKPIPFIAYTQAPPTIAVPSNVELRPAPLDNARLYDDGDVCVQPSHWEGIGLQLLECQSSGLPLVTTDGPPMNEFQPMRTIRSTEKVLLLSTRDHVLTSHVICPEDLAEELERLYGTDIGEASEQARAFVERRHSWDVAAPIFRSALSC